MAGEFQVNDVEELLELMERWGVGELHLTVGEASVDLVRATPGIPAAAEAPAPAPPAAPVAEQEAPEPMVIRAPVVGVFHLARRGFPHGAPRGGDRVEHGQTIGTIELMHVPTDLFSPATGVIEGILVEDGAGVEFGQPLMIIRPSEEVRENATGVSPSAG